MARTQEYFFDQLDLWDSGVMAEVEARMTLLEQEQGPDARGRLRDLDRQDREQRPDARARLHDDWDVDLAHGQDEEHPLGDYDECSAN